MEQGQAMFQESAITRTVAVDALSNRCIQLAAEKAAFENQLVEANKKVDALTKEVEALRPKEVNN